MIDRLYDFIFKPWRAVANWVQRAREKLRDDDWMPPPTLVVLDLPTGARVFIPLPGNAALLDGLFAHGATELGRTDDPQELEQLMQEGGGTMAKDTLEIAVDKQLIEKLRACREALSAAEQRAADAEAEAVRWKHWGEGREAAKKMWFRKAQKRRNERNAARRWSLLWKRAAKKWFSTEGGEFWRQITIRQRIRAEAAEAALAEAEYNLDSLRLERNMAETLMRKREVELSALRAVAEAVQNVPWGEPIEFLRMVVEHARMNDESTRADWLEGIVNALAALDTARGRPASRLMEQMPPCSHPGCYSHVTHPCEGCGRIQGYLPSVAREGGKDGV